ncbi:hypothetical protein NTB88_22005 [Aeromonas salmonicida]|nr:hypothetical protein [Aeromonas salmonicida]
MPVTLHRDTYDAILDDLKKLRERNAELERKAHAFDEVKNNIKEELDSYSVLYKETQDPRYSLLSGVYENIFNYIEELEREE